MTKAYDEKLLDKFRLLIMLLDRAFVSRGFDAQSQLYCYAVRVSFDCIRSELLYEGRSFADRVKRINEYLEVHTIKTAFEKVAPEKFNTMTKIKLFLVKKRFYRMLFLLFFIKNKYLILGGKKHSDE
jgi:hypothetical protein